MLQKSSAAYVLFYNRSENNEVLPETDQGAADAPTSARYPMVRRQSVTRPDLWPHTQVEDSKFRDYTRKSTMNGSMRSLGAQSPPVSPIPGRAYANVSSHRGPAPPTSPPIYNTRSASRSPAEPVAQEQESARKRSTRSGKKSSSRR